MVFSLADLENMDITKTLSAPQAKGFIAQMKDKTDFTNKPFEIFFSTIGPMAVWTMSPFFGAVAFVLGEFGIGLGEIGKFIDQSLGIGSSSKPNISDSSIMATTNAIIDKVKSVIKSKFGLSSSTFLAEIAIIKGGSINLNDVLAARLVDGITKEAGPFTFLSKVLRGKRMGAANPIYWLIKNFIKGLIGVGIVSEVAKQVKKRVAPTGFLPGSAHTPERSTHVLPEYGTPKTELYSNVENNVEKTLIKYLDIKIKNFSDTFKQIKGYELSGSKEMNSVIDDLTYLNWANSERELNDKNAFVSPPVERIAFRILPEVKYEKLKKSIPKTEKDLSGLL